MSEQTTQLTAHNVNLPAVSSATAVEQVRASEEIKALFLASQQWPRDTAALTEEVIDACSDFDFAKVALYEFRRGGTVVTGQSIRMLEEAVSIWGRIKYGWEVIDDTQPGKVYVRSYALDLQNLNCPERKFWVELGIWTVPDKSKPTEKKWKQFTDERDISERIANIAQRRTRTCLEQVIGKRKMIKFVAQIQETLAHGDPKPLKERIDKMLAVFGGINVTAPMIEKLLGNNIGAITEMQIARLLTIWNTLKDGAAKPEDYFDMTLTAVQAADEKAKGKKGSKEEKPPAETKKAEEAKGEDQPEGISEEKKPEQSRSAEHSESSGTDEDEPPMADVDWADGFR